MAAIGRIGRNRSRARLLALTGWDGSRGWRSRRAPARSARRPSRAGRDSWSVPAGPDVVRASRVAGGERPAHRRGRRAPRNGYDLRRRLGDGGGPGDHRVGRAAARARPDRSCCVGGSGARRSAGGSRTRTLQRRQATAAVRPDAATGRRPRTRIGGGGTATAGSDVRLCGRRVTPRAAGTRARHGCARRRRQRRGGERAHNFVHRRQRRSRAPRHRRKDDPVNRSSSRSSRPRNRWRHRRDSRRPASQCGPDGPDVSGIGGTRRPRWPAASSCRSRAASAALGRFGDRPRRGGDRRLRTGVERAAAGDRASGRRGPPVDHGRARGRLSQPRPTSAPGSAGT